MDFAGIVSLLKSGATIRTDITITHGASAVSTAPPKGYIWFLLGGIVRHVTGSSSYTFVRSSPDSAVTLALADTRNWSWYTMVEAAEATAAYPLFNQVAEPYVAGAQLLIVIDNNSRLWFAGTAGAFLHPIVLEVKL